jgi:chemotaxis receptor (MCP) glutamine deamidase CheD
MAISEIPQWIANIYYKVDKNKDGITQDEIDNLDRQKEGIGSIYQFEAGMDLNSFVEKNRSVFAGYVHERNTSVDSNKSIEVGQGEYAIAEYSEDTPAMQTFGIGPCVAVTIYDKTSKRGFLTHIDSTDKANSFGNILKTLPYRGFNLENCEVRIIGGQTGQSEETIKIIQQSVENTPATIAEMDVLGNTTRSIQMNLDTGEVTDYDETIHTRQNEIQSIAFRTLTSNTLTEYKIPQHGI